MPYQPEIVVTPTQQYPQVELQSQGYPYTTWGQILGAPYITVSSKGIANGLSVYKNDGAMFGPDTLGTETVGIQEAISYASPLTLNIKVRAGHYIMTAPWKSMTISDTSNIGTTLYYLIELPYQPSTDSSGAVTVPVFLSIEGEPNVRSIPNYQATSSSENLPANVVIDISNIPENTLPCAQYIFAIPEDPAGGGSMTIIRMTGITFYSNVVTSIGAVFAPKAMGGWYDQLVYYDPAGYTTNAYTSVFAISNWIEQNSFFGDLTVRGAYSAFDIWHSHTTGFSLSVSNSGIGIQFRAGQSHGNYIFHYGVSSTTYPIYAPPNNVTSVGNANLCIDHYGREIDGTPDSYDVYLAASINQATIKIGTTRIYAAFKTNSLYPPLADSQTGELAYPLSYAPGQNNYTYKYVNFGYLEGIIGFVTPTISANPPTSGGTYENTLPYAIRLKIPVTYNPTTTEAATLATGISYNGTVTTTIKVSIPAGLTSADGQILTYEMIVPAGWYYELVATNATIGTAEVQVA